MVVFLGARWLCSCWLDGCVLGGQMVVFLLARWLCSWGPDGCVLGG